MDDTARELSALRAEVAELSSLVRQLVATPASAASDDFPVERKINMGRIAAERLARRPRSRRGPKK